MAEDKSEEIPQEEPADQDTSTDSEAKTRHTTIAACIALAAIALLSIHFLRPIMVGKIEKVEAEQAMLSCRNVEYGQWLSTKNQFNDAFRHIRFGLACAENTDDRVRAGLAAGELLVKQGDNSGKQSYAIMAKEYFRAVADIAETKDDLYRAWRGLASSAIQMKDLPLVSSAMEKAVALAPSDDARTEMFLAQFDCISATGSRQETSAILANLSSEAINTKWEYAYAKRMAILSELTFSRDVWFQEYLNDDSSRLADADAARQALLKDTLSQLSNIAETEKGAAAADALFRSARLMVEAGEYDEARLLLERYLIQEPNIHQKGAMLLMAIIAHKTGQSDEAETLIATFLQRYSWSASAGKEFLMIVDHAIGQGRYAEAISLLEQYICLPRAREFLSELLSRAGSATKALGRNDDAKHYYMQLAKHQPHTRAAADAMLNLIDISKTMNDFDGARLWAVRYLNRFPHEEQSGDTLFTLLDMHVALGVGDAQAIGTAIVAADRRPEDVRSRDALMIVANRLESIGLYDHAQQQYNKIALLQCVQPDNLTASQEAEHSSDATPAILGSARCLYMLDRTTEADHLLRQLCNSEAPSNSRSEAAYWWARLALDSYQYAEASRRLQLVDTNAPPDIIARASFDRMLINVASGQQSAVSTESLKTALEAFPPEEHSAFVRKAYQAYFDKLSANGNTQGMKDFHADATLSASSSRLPLSEWQLRIGLSALINEGRESFITHMSIPPDENGADTKDSAESPARMTDAAANIEKSRKRIDSYL